MMELTWLTGPLAYVCRRLMSPASPAAAGTSTSAAAPSPKIIRDGRTVPILSENFSPQTSNTGRFTSCRIRVASDKP